MTDDSRAPLGFQPRLTEGFQPPKPGQFTDSGFQPAGSTAAKPEPPRNFTSAVKPPPKKD